MSPHRLGESVVGVYSVSSSVFDVALLGLFGGLGYLMRKLDYPAAPLVLGLVLGDPMERALRQSLMMSQGDLAILATRPIAAVLLLLALAMLVLPLFRRINAWRLQATDQ
jgi:putative tricarboxylic transport membrane protein